MGAQLLRMASDSRRIVVDMSRLFVLTVIVLCGCAVDKPNEAAQVLLIVRERLRPGSEEAYNDNELRIAEACARLGCPHPYVALASTAGPNEVWWLNAFASQAERDDLEQAYTRNAPLMARLRPLGKRKEDFRVELTTKLTEYRPELSSNAVLRIGGARFFVINSTPNQEVSTGAVFESSDGERFAIASVASRAAAEDVASRSGSGAMILSVQPQWSFPAQAWIEADRDFWKSSTVARYRQTSETGR